MSETPANNVVKDSPFKGKRNNNNTRGYFSDKKTPPYNDVIRKDDKSGELVLVPGISEEEKIAEGSMPPLQYKNAVATTKFGTERQVGRFEKSSFDRKEWKRVHTNAKLESNGSINRGNRHSEKKGTLIVHLANFRRKADFKDFKAVPVNPKPSGFKTTYSFADVKESEIFQVLSTIIRLDRNNKHDHVLNYVTKYYFVGKQYDGKAKVKQR